FRLDLYRCRGHAPAGGQWPGLPGGTRGCGGGLKGGTLADHMLSPDTQVILLLCGRFGQTTSEAAQPLTQSEYHRLTQWLESQEARPADLLEPGGLDR